MLARDMPLDDARHELPNEALRAAFDALPLLVDSLLHDARNPLNALSINVEVLAERLRREGSPEMAAAHEKNLKAIRDQVHRVDDILRRYADFLAPATARVEAADLSAVVQRALEVLGHESRKRKLTVHTHVVPLRVRAQATVLHHLVLQAVLRGIQRSPLTATLRVTVRQEGKAAVLRIDDEGPAGDDNADRVVALNAWSESQEGRLGLVSGGVLEVHLPLA